MLEICLKKTIKFKREQFLRRLSYAKDFNSTS
jgi:hypothetical protein